MSYYQDGPAESLAEEQHTEEHQLPRPVGARLADLGGRISKALSNLDRGRIDQFALDPGAGSDEEHDVVGEVSGAEHDLGLRATPRPPDLHQPDPLGPDTLGPEAGSPLESEDELAFPVGRLGYNRVAVDARIAELERELEELRAVPPQPSITEEIERLGEQTASILVVAHDQAHETTRLAQEQADRCIANAASNAVALTEEAKATLRNIDEETDAVWRERDRLIDDARSVGAALISLAASAAERFPAESNADKSAGAPVAGVDLGDPPASGPGGQ